jgi:hypothetical protein
MFSNNSAWASRQQKPAPVLVYLAEHERPLVHRLERCGFSLNVAALIARLALTPRAA